MIFYFRLIDQPCFMLDLNYEDGMTELVKIIRRQAKLPTKRNDTKIVLDSKLPRPSVANTKLGSEASSSKKPSRQSNSSVLSWGDQEKYTGTSVNSSAMKYFGPLFEEYRQKKAEMKLELLGPSVPFAQVPLRNPNELPANPLVQRKAVHIDLKPLEILSNDFANSIIDGTQSTTKAEVKLTSSETASLQFRNPVTQSSNQ